MYMRLSTDHIEDYRRFLKIKAFPKYRIVGRGAYFPDEYADRVDATPDEAAIPNTYEPWGGLFDYQRDITQMAIAKQKFAIFADCGLGKTRMFLEFARYAAQVMPTDKRILIVSPLMVIGQTIAECATMYGDDERGIWLERVPAKRLNQWLAGDGHRIGITNYDALTDEIQAGQIGALILDESSMLKSHYGAWGQHCLRLGRGLDWKLASTGTPAPNDRIEYANHAVFLDAFPTINAFLARFFINRAQTDNRWEMKKHAVGSFYRSLSHWSIFLTDPAVYGWTDNSEPLPDIHVHYHEIPLTPEQVELSYGKTGHLFADRVGGITSRSVLSQIAKGSHRGKDVTTNKPAAIKALVDSWPNESTIIWCLYNREQDLMCKTFPDASSIDGSTPMDIREQLVSEFKAGIRKVLISKPKVLGFGLNLQVATRQVFSGLQDSYEAYYQCVKRSNRYGSVRPLNVHIPYTDIEKPMIDNVMRKADCIDRDTREQQEIFKNETLLGRAKGMQHVN